MPSRVAVVFRGGDVFDARTLPRGRESNCYILKVMLHGYSDAKAVQILRTIAQALDAAGVPRSERKLFVAEAQLVSDDALEVPKLGLDVNMMVMAGGKERTVSEWKQLLDEAGWVLAKSHPTTSFYTVMEAVAM